MKSLDTLKDINYQLDEMIQYKRPNYVEYTVERGECIGFSLYHQDDAAIQRAYLSKGTIFPKHHHDEKEIIVIISGKIKGIFFDNDGSVLEETIKGPSDLFDCIPGIVHTYEILENSWVIGITVPSSEGYP